MIKLIKKILGIKTLYSYIDEELIIDNVDVEKLFSLELPDYVLVRRKGRTEWRRWGEEKKRLGGNNS